MDTACTPKEGSQRLDPSFVPSLPSLRVVLKWSTHPAHGYIGIMENNMETTIMVLYRVRGFIS